MRASVRQILNDLEEENLAPENPWIERPRVWTQEWVIRVLGWAWKVNDRTEGRIGPGGYGQAMPDYRYEGDDWWEQRRTGTNQVGRLTPKIQPTAREIAIMERVLVGVTEGGVHKPAWIPAYLSNHRGWANCLIVSTRCDAFNYPKGLAIKNRGWSRSTFSRQRDKGAQRIAEGLNRDGVEIYDVG